MCSCIIRLIIKRWTNTWKRLTYSDLMNTVHRSFILAYIYEGNRNCERFGEQIQFVGRLHGRVTMFIEHISRIALWNIPIMAITSRRWVRNAPFNSANPLVVVRRLPRMCGILHASRGASERDWSHDLPTCKTPMYIVENTHVFKTTQVSGTCYVPKRGKIFKKWRNSWSLKFVLVLR